MGLSFLIDSFRVLRPTEHADQIKSQISYAVKTEQVLYLFTEGSLLIKNDLPSDSLTTTNSSRLKYCDI